MAKKCYFRYQPHARARTKLQPETGSESYLRDGGSWGRVLGDGLPVEGAVELRGVVVLVDHVHHDEDLAAQGALGQVIRLHKMLRIEL